MMRKQHRPNYMDGATFLFSQFHLQPYTYLDTFNESSPFMIPAELADRVDDLIHLPERHPVHPLVSVLRHSFAVCSTSGIRR